MLTWSNSVPNQSTYFIRVSQCAQLKKDVYVLPSNVRRMYVNINKNIDVLA